MDRSRTSVLVVDPDEAFRRDVMQGLREAGFAVAGQGNGSQALRAIRQEPPDVLLTDLRLPGTRGLDLIGEVRTRNPRSVAIAVSAARDVDAVVECFRTGAKDFVNKPVSLDELVYRLQKCLVDAEGQVVPEPWALAQANGQPAVESPGGPFGSGDGSAGWPGCSGTPSGSLCPGVDPAQHDENLRYATRQFERRYILQVLQAHGGRKSEAAEALGIGLSSLYRKMEDLGIPRRRASPRDPPTLLRRG